MFCLLEKQQQLNWVFNMEIRGQSAIQGIDSTDVSFLNISICV